MGKLFRFAFGNWGNARAFFAHPGNPRRAVRVGFEETRHPNLVVRWSAAASSTDPERILEDVAALGAF